jgi:hypothetical protein
LAQRLAQKQSELEQARQAYEGRLANLTRQKEALETQLRAVEAEIQAVHAKALPSATPASKPKATRAPGNGKKATAAGAKAAPRAAPAKVADEQGKGSLRALLVELLSRSDRPMRARELADQALQAGYQTESRDFINVVWDALGKIPEVKNIRGKGYLLKKHPAKAAK